MRPLNTSLGPPRPEREVLIGKWVPSAKGDGRGRQFPSVPPAGCGKLRGARDAGPVSCRGRPLEAIADLVAPEALEAEQRSVEAAEIVRRHLTHGLNGAELAGIELRDDVASLGALGRQAHPDRAPIG